MNRSETAPAEHDALKGTVSVKPDHPFKNRLIVLAAFALALLVAIILFEPLFLGASLLSVDNRIVSPFRYHLPEDEPPRVTNMGSKDINAFVMPETLLSLERWRAGELPLWNPHEVMGQPLHASMGFVSFYPTVGLYLVMEPLRAYTVALALHMVLLGLGAYLLFLRGGLQATPALFGAMLAMLCGYLSTRFHLACFIIVAAWYPWILLASEMLIDRPTPRRVAVLALFIGLSLLGGFPQIAMFMLYASAAAFFVRWIMKSRQLKILLLGLIAALLGGSLSAVLMLPAAEFLSHSTRSTPIPDEQFDAKTLYPMAVVGAVLPRFFGDPVQEVNLQNPTPKSQLDFPTYSLTPPDHQNVFTENTFFMGCVPLVIIMIALARGMQKRNRFHLVMAVVAFGIAFGVPLLIDAARWLPGVSTGCPKRALWIASFSLAWLAASGIASVMKSPGRWMLVVMSAAGMVFVALGALSWLPFETWILPEAGAEDAAWFREVLLRDLRNAGMAGVVLLVAAGFLKQSTPTLAAVVLIVGGTVEVAYFAWSTNPTQSSQNQFASTPAIDWLKEKGADSDCRIVSFQNTEALPASMAQLFGIRSMNGYTAMTHRRTAELFDALDPEILRMDERIVGAIREVENLRHPLLDLLNVRYVACSLEGYNLLEPRLAELPDLVPCYMNKNEVLALYERKTALPPAFMVNEVRYVGEKDERLALLTSCAFDAANIAIVEEAVPASRPGELTQGTVVYRRPSAERIELKVDGAGPGFVVVSETHFPGWEAAIDGKPAPLVQTNHSLMGIAVPAGSHSIRIVYRPDSFFRGVALSGAALLICLILFLMRERKKKIVVNPVRSAGANAWGR